MTRRLTIVAHEIGAWANHRAQTAELARKEGWTVTLLVGGEGDPVPIAAKSAPIYESLPMARGKGGVGEAWRTLRVLRRVIRAADVVELVTLKPIVFGMIARRTLRRSHRPRVVATFAGLGTVLDDALTHRVHWFVIVLGVLLRGQAAVLVENPDDAVSLVSAHIVRDSDVIVGPGVGLPDEWLDLDPNPLGNVNDPTTILFVGRIIASKGVLDLISALKLLRERGVHVRAVLAGALDDRNPSALSPGEVARWQAAGLVEWIGHVDDLLPVYRSADIVVLPSHREGRPRSLMEAQTLGIPVIATDVPGCRQVMVPGHTGLLVPARDPQTLAVAIEKLSGETELRRQLGANARAWAHEEFRREKFLTTWAEVVLRPPGFQLPM